MSTDIIKDHGEFFRAAEQKADGYTSALYTKLIDEEVREFFDADAECDITEMADACIDIIVVALGKLRAMGLDPQPLWDEVHRSNMAKFIHDGVPGIKRRPDGKILKPEGWTPPALAEIVEQQLRAGGGK
jgi:predicted HAD superfamily Cof-like phosphohydrolase